MPGSGRRAGFLSAAGKQLATLHDDKICLWDVPSGKQIWAVPAKLGDDEIHGQRFAFSAGGKLLAWNESGKITVADAATGKATMILKAQPGPLAFSPDGRRLALACQDGTALIWEVAKS